MAIPGIREESKTKLLYYMYIFNHFTDILS